MSNKVQLVWRFLDELTLGDSSHENGEFKTIKLNQQKILVNLEY